MQRSMGLSFESLEPRLLLAADLNFGSADDLTLDFLVSGPDETFQLKNGATVVNSITRADWTGSDLVIEGSAGADTLRLAAGLPFDVSIKFKGGAGADTLVLPDAFDVFDSTLHSNTQIVFDGGPGSAIEVTEDSSMVLTDDQLVLDNGTDQRTIRFDQSTAASARRRPASRPPR